MARRWHNAVLTATALLPFAVASAFAGPNGAHVVGGAATVQGQGTGNVVVNQSSQNAIINWQTFNIGSGETTKILMPNSSSTQLDRVTGGQGPSQILGTLYSNGKIFLVNPDGILFGMGASINVGSLLATTNNITNKNFMAGRYQFTIPGNPNASIVNMGSITAQTGGFAALVAPGVRNTGTITAKLGTIALASGNAFTLDMYGDNLITLGLTDSISSQVVDVATGQPLKSLVSNEGKLKANGGTVTLTAAAARAVVDSVINNSGVIEANSIGSHNGMIVLGAATAATKPPGAPTQTVTVSGKLSAKGKRKSTTGGTIIVTGENIAVSGATINASGNAGGGKVLIGGDWGGGHPNTSLVSGNTSASLQPYTVPNSSTVSIDAATMIDASATTTGNGGKVIVWANQATTFLGTILAKGGAQSGNGGFVETSGGTLSFNGSVNTSAPNGKTGTWLLDPTDLMIDAAGAATISNGLAGNNVVVYTDADGTTSGQGTTTANGLGDIIVTAPISWSSNTTLTLDAYHNVDVDAHITSTGGGNLILRADNSGTDIGTVIFNADSGRISTSGAVSIFYNPANNPGNGTFNTSSYTTPTNYSQFVTGGTLTSYMLVNNVYDLQNIQNNLLGTYALGKNIDASATANFIPIGNSQSPFTGSLNGDGFAINNLTINSSAAYVGLFGTIGSGGSVQNLGIGNISLTATGWNGSGGDYAHVGALAALNQGTISNSYASGMITSSSPFGTAPDTGGLVGTNAGSISQSYASVKITENSSGDSLYLGGLVGWNKVGGSITQSYATGIINNADSNAEVGGLIGLNSGTVSQSYSIGAVSGLGTLGGLIGSNVNPNAVTSSYWDTQTSGLSSSAAGLPLMTAQFQSGLPLGFDATAWASSPGAYPYLLWQLGSGAQVLAGYVYNDAGITLAGGGIGVSALVNGNAVGSVTTGANGSYNVVFSHGTISSSGSQVLTYTSGGAAYVQNATGSVTNLNIYEGYLNETGGATTLSGLSAGLATALGGNTSVVSGLNNRAINATGTSFAIDQSLSAGTLLLSANGAVTQSAPLNVMNLALLGGSASFTLTNGANQVGTLAANAGSVNLTNATSLNIGSVGSTSGVTASGALTLSVTGNISDPAAPVNVGTFTLANGDWTQLGSLPNFSANNFVIGGGSFVRALGGYGTAASPLQITDVYGLQGIGSNATTLSESYVLANAIDASGTTGWNGGAGFVPLGGNNATSFTGTLNGNSNTISGLTMRTSNGPTGMFGSIGAGGTVENVGLLGGSVNGILTVGELAGVNSGTVNSDYATGSVIGSFDLGGLVGDNKGTISNSYATGAVNGSFNAGGLVGENGGTVTQSYATGSVINGETILGGLVGINDPGASISQSYATGAVTSPTISNAIAGGLVGDNFGTIAQSHATGNVSTGDNGIAGGLVGENSNTASNGNVIVASITGSYATGNVSAGNGSFTSTTSTAGGLVGDNFGSVTQSYATGAVTVGANGAAGGLVGQNGFGASFGQLGTASISNSYATGAVSSSGINVQLGGLVGQNDSGAQITNSQASGNVTSTATLPPGNNDNCSGSGSCEYANLGGFVGANFGSISGTMWTNAPANCAASYACASGAVSVGAIGSGGGFAGLNQGIISYAFATGKVTGVAGQADTVAGDTFDNNTTLGGFVAFNQGQISHSFSTGQVGTAGTMWLSAGGFAADNHGTIDASFATGAVMAGDNSTAGGFASSNSPSSNPQNCPDCMTGDGFNNGATISNSQAYGNVTVGALSVAGGFAAIGDNKEGQSGSTFTNITAANAVNAGHDSIVGGLVGVLTEGSTVANSTAHNTIVASSGANSIIGGVVGLNEGTISGTASTAPVSGTSDSYIGGITGINLGLITGSSTDPAITGSGGNDFIGGIAGLNAGSINGSTANIALSSGSPNYSGGVAGVNGSFSNEPAIYPYSSFPNGTITNSSATGTGFSGPTGTSAPAWSPGLPAWLAGCNDAGCSVLTGGTLQAVSSSNSGSNSGSSKDDVPANTLSTNQQTGQFTPPINNAPSTPPPLINTASLNTDAAANAANGAGNSANGGGAGNPANGTTGSTGGGSLASGLHGGNGAPNGMRLIDMPVMPLPPGSGLPPSGETRFLLNEVVLQFGPEVSPQQVTDIARRLGLVIVSQQTIAALHRTVYTFRITGGQSVAEIIRQVESGGVHVAAQPNYTYGLSQDPSVAGGHGDPAQYIVQKLQLGAVHRITEGNNIVVALIDSQVDPRQPDFAGRIVDSYDAGCGPNTPPDAHGTGMAGAIASHIGLLGVAPNARIIAICAFGGHGTPEATSTKIIRGVDYAIAHGAKIINMSFAGPQDPALAQELQIAREKGILIIAAAGNAGAKSPPLYPGADPNVMAVTATDEHDRLFNGANQGSYVAVAAPGVNILVPAPNGDVQFTTGTSVASANVSGVAALLMAEKPTRTPEEIRAILASTAKHLGAKGMNPQFGAGLVDPLKALRFVPTALGRKPTAEAATPLQLH